ncbi:glycosyltransferase family 4 protein [Salinimicrobium sp. CAU 1759]
MNRQKKIAVVCNYRLDPHRIGGMDRFFRAYNEEFLQKGHKLIWFFSAGEKFEFYSGFELVLAAKGQTLEDLVLDHLKKNNPFDSIVTHFLPLCTPFFKKLKENNKPFIIAVDHNPRPLKDFPLKKRIKNRIKGRLYSGYIDCFVGVSEYTANHILKDYGKGLKRKTTVVYNGIDTSVYEKRTEENRGKFIVASHLRESKGIQDLIEAVNLLPQEYRNLLKIDIFGEGPQERILKNKVMEYELGQQIEFQGSSSKLPELFQNYSFLLQPTYMECFSLSILESLAANVPVITTPVGGNIEIIGNGKNGFLFPPGDITALRNLLSEVLNHKASIRGDVSLEIEKDYNLKKMVKEHLSLLPCI